MWGVGYSSSDCVGCFSEFREGGCDKETGDGGELVGSHGRGLTLWARVLVEQGTLQVGQEDDLDRWDRRMTLTGGTGRGRQHSIQNPGENFSG